MTWFLDAVAAITRTIPRQSVLLVDTGPFFANYPLASGVVTAFDHPGKGAAITTRSDATTDDQRPEQE